MSSGYRSFGGEWTRGKKVSLAGRSRTEESSREEMLERTRQERERRRQHKLETRSATSIQAIWRSWRSRRKLKAALRERWVARYGQQGERASAADLAPASPFLRELECFAEPASAEDVQLLAAACRVLLAAAAEPAVGPAAAPPQPLQQQQLAFCTHAADVAAGAVIAVRAQRLVSLAVAALARHAPAFVPQLRALRQGGAAAAGLGPAAALLQAAIALTGAETWKQAVGGARASEISAQVLAYAAERGLFADLSCIVTAAVAEAPPPANRVGVPAAEALVTSLVVRLLAVQQGVASRLAAHAGAQQQGWLQQGQPPLAQQQGQLQQQGQRQRQPNDPARLLAGLLCQPLLVQRCPTLRPLAPRLWRQAVASLHGMRPPQLVTWLGEQAQPGDTAAATGAALLGNLLEHAAAALKADDAAAAGAARPSAAHFVVVAAALLQLLPLQPLFPSGWVEEEEEEVAVRVGQAGAPQAPPPAGDGTVGRLPWDTEQMPPVGLLAQLQAVSNAALLRSVLRLLLPAASAAEAAAAAATVGEGAGERLRRTAATVQQLCRFLRLLLGLPGLRQRVLIALAVGGELVQRMWFSYLREAHMVGGQGWLPSADASCDPGWMLPLTLFSLAYSSFMMLADDDELYNQQRPLPLAELYAAERPRGLVSLLKFCLWHALWVEAAPSPGGWAPEAAALRQQLKAAAGKLMGQLYDRNCRRAFAPTEAFQSEALPGDRFQSEVGRVLGMGLVAGGAAAQQEAADGAAAALAGARAPVPPGDAAAAAASLRAWGLLTYAPCLVPFRERAKVFQSLVSQERAAHRDMEVAAALRLGAGIEPSRFVTIRRTQLLQDGYDQLGGLGEALRGRIRIQFIDAHGLEEAGVDGGGIFKEFIEEAVREGFDPRLGLFRATTDQRLYPSPHARAAVPGALRMIEFLGKVLGKAMFEGILVELPLAGFFLKKFRGALCDINDLPTLDPQLHRSLLFLKHYEGDVADLGLAFTVTDEVMGETREVELVPGGRDLAVTGDNRLAYIHRVADHRLNQQIREPAAAFLRGLHELVPPEWVAMFNEEELQMLVSGGQQGLDIADMRAHCQYSGGYHEEHPVIQAFWQALDSLSPAEQADFLRFVTSCPRPPLLGFRYLEPPLAIQMAGGVLDPGATERLPTAATCMNLLKLPPYTSAAQVRRKLLYAIQAGAGFELS